MKKVLWFSIVGLFFLLYSVTSAENTKPPFSVGERLRYFIYAAKLYVGYQTIELESVEKINNIDVYKLSGNSKSAFLVSIIYRLDDKWTIFMEKSTLLPIRVEKDMVEGRSSGYFIYEIDQENNTVVIQDRAGGKQEIVNSQNLVFDLFSLLYFFRSNPSLFEETFTFDFLESHNVHTVHFQDEGEVEVIIPRISKKREVIARKLRQVGGLGIEIYVSNDELRLPLKLVSPAILPRDKRLMIELYIDRYTPGVEQTAIPEVYRRLSY